MAGSRVGLFDNLNIRVGLFDNLNIPIHRDAQHREDPRRSRDVSLERRSPLVGHTFFDSHMILI